MKKLLTTLVILLIALMAMVSVGIYDIHTKVTKHSKNIDSLRIDIEKLRLITKYGSIERAKTFKMKMREGN